MESYAINRIINTLNVCISNQDDLHICYIRAYMKICQDVGSHSNLALNLPSISVYAIQLTFFITKQKLIAKIGREFLNGTFVGMNKKKC